VFWWREEVLPGVSVAFTDAGSGNLALHVGDDPEAVSGRRSALEVAAGVRDSHFQYMDQVHGNAVAAVDGHGDVPTADAMVSLGQPLAVMVADCVPVVLVGARAEGLAPVLAVAHAGRPGVASRIVPATVDQMRSRGAEDIQAWIGPSICGRCYEVPAAMQADVAAVEPSAYSTTSWGTPGLDLPSGVRSQLEHARVAVRYSGGCTLENDGLFSYRRNKDTGRFAGLVWLND